MSFISTEFLIFFIVVMTLYFWLPFRFRWILLFVASYFFYAYWNASYILLIVFSTFVDYWAARAIEQTPSENVARRRLFLTMSLTVNLGVLFLFKYFNFFNQSLADAANALNITYSASTLNVLLPMGISFYTFQSMAYTIDVYRGVMKAEKHPGIFATYIAFFPQLVAGPIERASNLLPQFYIHFKFDYERVVDGLRLILWGVFKKVVIADRLAQYVNGVYNHVDQFSGVTLVLATVFFAFQIYCDFSGYSDIAIGTAKVLGFNLMDNFRQPYLSTSIREFWRRWHISLSTWFRDYLYIPLGGNRVSFARNLINLLIVFTVSGLWHGANWTFFVWGLLHGLYIIGEIMLARITTGFNWTWHTTPVGRLARGLLVFVLVCVAWVFFRANNLGDAMVIFNHLLDFSNGVADIAAPFTGALLGMRTELMLSLLLIGILLLVDWYDSLKGLIPTLVQMPTLFRWAIYYGAALIIGLSIFDSAGTSTFIYFQF